MSTSKQRIRAYFQCVIACEMCIKDCTNDRLIRCLELCRECSELCTLGMRLESQFAISSQGYYEFCKQICMLCSEECLKYATIHSSCNNCYQACKMMLRPELFY
jgi:hypothetical protein